MGTGRMSSIYDYSAERLNGEETSLADFRGRVLLVVNVASKCGFTHNMKDSRHCFANMEGRVL